MITDQSGHASIDGLEERVRGNAWAATAIISGPVGEFSVIYNRYAQRWIMLYTSEPDNGIMLRDAPGVTLPWFAPKRVWHEPGSYGCYMHPFLVENDGESCYFTMSRWFPYQVYLKAHLVVE